MPAEYFQNHKLPQPLYQEYSTPSPPFRYSCTATLPSSIPNSPAPSEPFGSTTQLFVSKKAARSAAAKDAVLWLRQQGQIPNLTQLTTAESFIDLDPSLSPAEKVHTLIAALGLCTPRFHCTPTITASGEEIPGGSFWDVEATFDRRDVATHPCLGGAVGTVRGVFGKAKARSQCAEGVLGVLEGLREERRG